MKFTWIAPIAVAALLIIGIETKYQSEISGAKSTFKQSASKDAANVGVKVENQFRLMYQGLRTMARLPGVRSIDRYAKNFDGNARGAMQEIYNNLGSNISMSEVYVVQKSLEPDRIDPVTKKLEAPITTFDKLIVNPKDANEKEEKSSLEEIEIYEYRLEKQQLAYLRSHYPRESSIDGLNYPAISGPEVITCDNSRIKDPKHFDNKDRSGVVYSVPYYAPDGEFAGSITGIMLSSVVGEQTKDPNYAIICPTNHYAAYMPGGEAARSKSAIANFKPNTEDIYSEILPLRITDSQPWKLWVALPDSVFWNSPSAKGIQTMRSMEYAGMVLLVIAMFGGLYVLQGRAKVQQQNLDLQSTLAENARFVEAKNTELTRMVDRMRESNMTVHRGITTIASAVSELTVAMERSEDNSTHLLHSVESIAESADEVSACSKASAQSGRDLASSSTNAKTAIEALGTSIKEIMDHSRIQIEALRKTEGTVEAVSACLVAIKKVDAIKDQANLSVSAVHELSERSQHIGSIVDTIDDIAKQTNLLALNAAVEAARAGANGAGFAVVAEEVRKLAARSAEAAQEIRDLIEAVLSNVGQVTESMGKGARQVEETSRESTAALGSLQEQVSGIEQVQIAVRDMDARVRTMASHLDRVSSATEYAHSVSLQTATSAEQISTLAAEVESHVATLKNLAADEVKRVGKNRQSIQSLAEVANHLNNDSQLADAA